MREIPKHGKRRQSIVSLGVGQLLRPTLAPSTAFSTDESSRSPLTPSTPRSPRYLPMSASRAAALRSSSNTPVTPRAFASRPGAAHFLSAPETTMATSLPQSWTPPQQKSSTAAIDNDPPSASKRPQGSITTQMPAISGGGHVPERVGSAGSSRADLIGAMGLPSTTGNLGASNPGMQPWPPSRRTSSIFNRRGTTAFHAMSGSVHDLGERSSSKLTLDEELYDLLFAYG
uniref:Uncharacterized protein n=1 Tax=Panagrellus redivivus TaxID=6233 RepID=A0A7E4VYB9_PANRE